MTQPMPQLPLAGSFEIFMHTEVTDTVTGFQGQIIARCEHLDGQRLYYVLATGGEGPLVGRWFDEDRIRPPAQVVTPTPVALYVSEEQKISLGLDEGRYK